MLRPGKRWLFLVVPPAACLAGLAGLHAFRSAKLPPRLTPLAIVATRSADGAPALVVAHRGETGEVTEIELLDSRNASTIWRKRVTAIQPEPEDLVTDGRVIVIAGQSEHSDTTLIGYDLATGREKWRAEPFAATTNSLWIHRGRLVALSFDEKLLGFELESGKKLWETAHVDDANAPIFVGDHLVIPTEHARQPALRIVNLETGAARDMGHGLGWPGAVVGDRYYALYRPSSFSDTRGGDELVSAKNLRELQLALDTDSGLAPRAPRAKPLELADAGTPDSLRGDKSMLVELLPERGEVRPVLLEQSAVWVPYDCVESSFFTLFEDRLLCHHDEGEWMFSRSWQKLGPMADIRAPAEMRYWDGGTADSEWKNRDRYAFLGAKTRFVPMILNQRGTDDATLCVLDFDVGKTVWCAEKKILNSEIELYGWLHVDSYDDVHVIHFPLRRGDYRMYGPLLVLDGKTGKFRGAIDLRAKSGPIKGWPSTHAYPSPRSGDVLAASVGDYFVGLDLKSLKLAFRRGPEPVELVSGLDEVERLLGPVPK